MSVSIDRIPFIAERARRTRRAVKYISKPGDGKNGVLETFCKEQGLGLLVRVIPNLDATGVVGWTVPQKREDGVYTIYTVSDMIAGIRQLQEDGYEEGYLLLDEFDAGDQLTKKALSQVVNEYKIGDYAIPEGYGVIAFSNRKRDMAGVTGHLAHVNNRMATVEVENNFSVWMKNYAVPTGLHWMYISAVEQFAADVFAPDIPEGCRESMIFPSARSVSNAALMHCVDTAASETMLPTEPDDRAIVDGFVGEDFARKLFTHFTCANELPTAAEIIRNPDTCKVPKENNTAAQYAALQMVMGLIDAEHADSYWTFAERLNPELLSATAHEIVRRKPRLIMSCQKLNNWLSREGDLVRAATPN